MRLILTAALLALPPLAGAAHAEMLYPVLIPSADSTGAIFDTEAAEPSEEGKATNVTMLATPDEKFAAGIYKAEAARFEVESYGVNEFMYFLEGGVTLTSADGTVTTVQAGDAVVIPQGWQGVWDSPGYRKYYVVYGAE